VYPEEVEAAIKSHPAVEDAIVVGVPDEQWGQRVAAVVALVDGADRPTLHALQAHCRSRLAAYKVPRSVSLVDSVRRSPAGKADYAWASALATPEAEPPDS
jgi:3-oxocholest-4-en-26-oate---CoA ligase